ncbi:uncharacterized protein LOC134822522 isoform X2 [Bolinopsis microptera]|uniref:uncharacterized protein LOC134822522 isoform X2 n=1 Tax=Bolinopsis microptera TaxID=2820187 RepID=UPI00307A0AC4
MNRKHSIKLSARSRCIMLVNRNVDKFSAGPGFLADDPPPLVLPKKNKKYAQRSAQFHKVRQPVQFTVFRNGLPSDKGTRFLLKAREMKSFETVLSIISFKIRLVEGAVRRLFTLEGGILHGPEDVVDGGIYVACGHRRFIAASYGELNQPAKTQKLPSIKRRKDISQPSPRTQSNPLPAIQKKAAEKKARSEKDSPAPIEEDKGNDDVLVIVSRGSQADLVDDQYNPDTVTSDNGTGEPLDEQASSANASVALMIDSPEGLKTPPPSGHVNYENDLHDTNYAVEGSGEGPGELTDGITPEVESQTDLKPKSGEITPRTLSPFEQDDESAGNAEPLVTPDAIDKTAPKNGPDVAPRASTPAVPNPGNEEVLEDEFIAHKEDDHVDAIVNGDAENDVEQNSSGDAGDVDTEKVGEVISRTDAVDTAIVGQAISDTVDTDDVDGDISATEISSVPSKSRSKLPVPKKSNQAVSSGELTDGGTSEAESETDFISEKGKITPRKFSPYEQAFHDDKLEGYTEILDKPLKTSDVLDDTAPNVYPEVFSRGSTLADSNPSDEDVLEGEITDGETTEAQYEADFMSDNGEITPPRLSPFEQVFQDDEIEEYTEILDEPLETPDVLDGTAQNVYPEVSPRGTSPADEEIFEGELTDGETTEAQYEADFMSDNGEITPPRLSPFEQVFQDDEIEEYTEILDEPLETPDVLDGTAQNVYPEVSPRGTSPADEEIFEGELTDGETTEAQYEADFMSDNGEITPPRLSPFEQVFQDDEIEEYTEIRDEPLETPDVLDDTAPNVYPEVSPRGTTPADEEIFEGELTGGETETPEAEFGTNIIPENGGLTPRSLSPFEQSSQDDEPLKTRDVMEDKAPNVYPEVFSKPHTPVRSNYSYSNSDNYSNSDEDVLEDEIKNVPSKSKLDRNPPQKKGNPELLANGTNDSVFNATAAAKPTNQDGQFLMNNVDEGETNGHEDVEEIEEDGELIEDKPIDLQHAEEIPDETLNQSRRRSVSSSK